MFFKVLSIECTILLIKFKNNVDVYIYIYGWQNAKRTLQKYKGSIPNAF